MSKGFDIPLPHFVEVMPKSEKLLLGLALVIGAYAIYEWQKHSLSGPLALKDKLPTAFGTKALPQSSYAPFAQSPPPPSQQQVPLDLTAQQAAQALGQNALQSRIPEAFGGTPDAQPTQAQLQAAAKVNELAQQQFAQSLPFSPYPSTQGYWGV